MYAFTLFSTGVEENNPKTCDGHNLSVFTFPDFKFGQPMIEDIQTAVYWLKFYFKDVWHPAFAACALDLIGCPVSIVHDVYNLCRKRIMCPEGSEFAVDLIQKCVEELVDQQIGFAG